MGMSATKKKQIATLLKFFPKNPNAVALGRLGGLANKGIPKPKSGRKRIYPQCPRYKAHRFVNNRCPCGYVRITAPGSPSVPQ